MSQGFEPKGVFEEPASGSSVRTSSAGRPINSFLLDQLSDEAGDALRRSTALSYATGHDGVIHMEHLLGGLFAQDPGPARHAILRKLSDRRFFDILRDAARYPDPWPVAHDSRYDHLWPMLSGHVEQALDEGRRVAEARGEQAILPGDLFAGAMSVDACEPVEKLRAAGVDGADALAWQPPPTTPATRKTAVSRKVRPDSPTAARLTVTAAAQTDQPTSTDQLGFDRLVDALAQLLNGTRTTFPLSIAITAPWGGGKSSVMRLLRDRLVADDVKRIERARRKRILSGIATARRTAWTIVEFPAWRYETGEQIWSAMAKATYDAALRARPRFRERLGFLIRLEIRRGAVVPAVLRAFALLVAGGVGIVVGAGVGSAAAAPTEATALAGGATGILASLQLMGTKLADPFKSSLESLATRLDRGDGFTLGAARQVDALMNLLLEKDGRVLILIDDVDRCAPPHLVRVVEAVHQIFMAGSDVDSEFRPATAYEGAEPPLKRPRQLVFLLGMDRDFVARGIEAEYKELIAALRERGDPGASNYGLSFLDKIVQLWITLPEPDLPSLQRLLDSMSGSSSTNGHGAAAGTTAPTQATNGRTPGAADQGNGHGPAGATAQRSTASEPEVDAEPAPPPDDSDEVNAAIRAGAAHLERNPRTVKRYNNAVRLQFHLASRAKELDKDEVAALARWVAIRWRWPALAEAMDGNDRLLKALELHANPKWSQSAAERALLDGQKRRASLWFSSADFADHDDLVKALVAPRKGAAMSRLPFDEFLRIS